MADGATQSVRPWRAEEFEARLIALEQQVAELMELKTASPRRVFMTDVVKWRLAGALPELQRRHRDYVTAKLVADHFGFPLDSTRIGIRKAIDAGKVKAARVPHRKEWIILLPDQEVPHVSRLPISKAHMDVLIDLKRMAVDGKVALSNNELGHRMGRCPTTVNYALRRLILDGYVRVIDRGEAGRPNTYFIPSAIQ